MQRILGKDKSERLPILALNDEGHHCWRPISDTETGASLTAEERQALKDEAEEARVWLDGLDRINNCGLAGAGKPGSRSRSICRQGRLHQGQKSSQGPILSAAGQRFRAGGRDRERDRQDSALPPDGRTPNFSAFGSASRNACNRVSPARNAVSRQAPTPQSHREARRVPGLAGRWKMGGKFILGPPSSRHPKSKRGFCAEGTRLTPMTPPAISRALRPLASPPGRSSSAG